MRNVAAQLVAVPILLVLSCASTPELHNPGIPRITKEALHERLGEEGLRIVDVRISGDWIDSDMMIVGASRGDPNDVSLWADPIPKSDTIVLYCS